MLKRFSFSNTIKILHHVQEISIVGCIFYVSEGEGDVGAQESSISKDSNVLKGVLQWSGPLGKVRQVLCTIPRSYPQQNSNHSGAFNQDMNTEQVTKIEPKYENKFQI